MFVFCSKHFPRFRPAFWNNFVHLFWQIPVNSIKAWPSTTIRMNGKTLEEVDQFKSRTKQGRNINKTSQYQTGANTLSHGKASNTTEKTTPSVFRLQSLSSICHLFCQYCSMDVRAGRWRRIWRGESRLLKTNATEECLAYCTGSIKQILWQQVDILAGCQRSLYYQASQAINIMVRPRLL